MSQTVGDFVVERMHAWGVRKILAIPAMGLTAGRLASVGAAVPYAIATKFAHSDRPVVARALSHLASEGSFAALERSANPLDLTRDLDLAPAGARRARQRPEGAAGDPEHERGKRGRLGALLDDLIKRV